jgi:hypothetical protein
MVFKSKPSMIQSEIPLIYRNDKSKDLASWMLTQSELKPPKKKKVVTFDRETLSCEYQYGMLAGLCLAEPFLEKVKADSKLRILVCGTGTGVLTMYVR